MVRYNSSSGRRALVKTFPERGRRFGACMGASATKSRSNGQAFKWSRRSLRDYHTISLDEQGGGQELIARLEAENAALRGSVVDLLLQIEALRM